MHGPCATCCPLPPIDRTNARPRLTWPRRQLPSKDNVFCSAGLRPSTRIFLLPGMGGAGGEVLEAHATSSGRLAPVAVVGRNRPAVGEDEAGSRCTTDTRCGVGIGWSPGAPAGAGEEVLACRCWSNSRIRSANGADDVNSSSRVTCVCVCVRVCVCGMCVRACKNVSIAHRSG